MLAGPRVPTMGYASFILAGKSLALPWEVTLLTCPKPQVTEFRKQPATEKLCDLPFWLSHSFFILSVQQV